MKTIPFQELYNSEFFISEALAKGQNWYTRNNFYSCIGKPKPSHTLLWFKNCSAKITDSNGKILFAEKNQVAFMSKGIEYTVEFFDTAPNQDDSIVFHLFRSKLWHESNLYVCAHKGHATKAVSHARCKARRAQHITEKMKV